MSAFDNIIGYASEKRELERICDVLKHLDKYASLGVSSPRGLLLYGVPGVGKTLMANSLIEESGRPVFVCRKDLPDAEFIKQIKATFEEAAANAPSIVFLDDIDKFANSDEKCTNEESYVTVQSCIDNSKGCEVFVLATANDIDDLPGSLLRAGRFDKRLEIEEPEGRDAELIISHYLSSKKSVSGVDASNIARIMSGRSCAELETIINEAGIDAGYEHAEAITEKHLIEACLKSFYDVPAEYLGRPAAGVADLSDRNNTMAEIIYHEAGHAVVSEVLCPGSVSLVSAFGSSGRSDWGGFTSYFDDGTWTPTQCSERSIIGSLGGVAAVEQKFGVIDLGGSDDIGKAFKVVRSLISSNCLCGFDLFGNRFTSQDLEARQEKATAAEIERYYRKAKEIIACNRDFFEAIAAALAEKGYLVTEDISKIRESLKALPKAA